jgi:hypothetical protein
VSNGISYLKRQLDDDPVPAPSVRSTRRKTAPSAK